MNALEQARGCLDAAIETPIPNDSTHCANVAKAAAFVAIAEQLAQPKFVRVGEIAIRSDCIAALYNKGDTVTIFSNTGAVLADLSDKERAAFLCWWSEYANVTRLEVE